MNSFNFLEITKIEVETDSIDLTINDKIMLRHDLKSKEYYFPMFQEDEVEDNIDLDMQELAITMLDAEVAAKKIDAQGAIVKLSKKGERK